MKHGIRAKANETRGEFRSIKSFHATLLSSSNIELTDSLAYIVSGNARVCTYNRIVSFQGGGKSGNQRNSKCERTKSAAIHLNTFTHSCTHPCSCIPNSHPCKSHCRSLRQSLNEEPEKKVEM